MHLIALGLNHRTAPVEVRERFSLSKEEQGEALERLTELSAVDEAVIISTCNRTEIYAVVTEKAKGREELQKFFASIGNDDSVEQYLYWFVEADCAEHLFRVASSLDSLVVGEGQILSQVKDAYKLARESGAVDTILNLLFQKAIAVGKKVRTETKIAYNAVSVSSAAAELTKEKLGTLEGKNALIFGAGKMAELMAQHLLAHGIGKIFVANRHHEKAVDFASRYQGIAVEFNEAFEKAAHADVVITSTGAPHYIVTLENVEKLMRERDGKPLVIVDIAVPRDVDPEVAEVEGVTLSNIDDLSQVVEEHRRERAIEAEGAGKIVYDELGEFLEKLKYLSCRPVMVRLSDFAETVRKRELKRIESKLPDLTEKDWRVIAGMTRMITRKLLREPMSRLAEAGETKHEEYYLRAVRNLFRIEGDSEVKPNEE